MTKLIRKAFGMIWNHSLDNSIRIIQKILLINYDWLYVIINGIILDFSRKLRFWFPPHFFLFFFKWFLTIFFSFFLFGETMLFSHIFSMYFNANTLLLAFFFLFLTAVKSYLSLKIHHHLHFINLPICININALISEQSPLACWMIHNTKMKLKFIAFLGGRGVKIWEEK